VAGFFTKWLQDLEDAQGENGAFPDVAPRIRTVGEGTAAWGDAGVICPWAIYLAYGDRRQLEARYPSMVRWVEYCRRNSNNLLRPAAGYGDWLSIRADTPKDVLATAYFAHSTNLVAKAARALGKTEDAQKYDSLFNDIRAAFNKAYVGDDGKIKGDTQTAYLLALRFGLLDSDAKRHATARRLADDILARNGHLSTGFVGVGYICPTLTDIGRNDLAYRLLLNDTFPSWGYTIKNGATTIWERWDGWTHDKGFQDPGMNSFNHYAFGSVGEWLFDTVAGIATSENAPGYKQIVIRPQPGPGLTSARAHYHSLHGPITTDWRKDGDRFTLAVTIPANTTATIYVPAPDNARVTESGKPAERAADVTLLQRESGFAVYTVGSGTYRFVAGTNSGTRKAAR
jgi:alpha-L-rhamnosidase